jgi:hypothetical protein
MTAFFWGFEKESANTVLRLASFPGQAERTTHRVPVRIFGKAEHEHTSARSRFVLEKQRAQHAAFDCRFLEKQIPSTLWKERRQAGARRFIYPLDHLNFVKSSQNPGRYVSPRTHPHANLRDPPPLLIHPKDHPIYFQRLYASIPSPSLHPSSFSHTSNLYPTPSPPQLHIIPSAKSFS